MADKYTAKGVPFLRSQNIEPFRLNLDDLKFVPADFHHKLAKSALRPGDVAVVRTGYPGTACVIPDSFPELNCADLVVITPSRELNAHYLAAIFNSAWGVASVAGNLVGVAQQHFNIGSAKELKVELPDRQIQDRIAGILSAYDELIENCQRRVRILETMARAFYREWFDNRSDSNSGSFGDVCSIERNGINPSDSPDEDFEHFSIPSFDDGRQAMLEAGSSIHSAKYLIDERCVLLSKLNPRIRRVWLPAPRGGYRAISSTEFLVLRPRTGFSVEYVYALCESDDFARQFMSLAIGTSTSHQRVKPDDLVDLPLTVPSDSAVKQFTETARPMLSLAESLRKEVLNLRQTRDLLLPRLLSGQIDLS